MISRSILIRGRQAAAVQRAAAIAALVVSAVLGSSRADAALIASEAFDYTEAAGTSIAGLNGGTGWDEAYPAPSGTVALQAGLSFPGIGTSGQSMQFGSNANLTTNGRNWEASAATQDYWYSFLMNPITDGNGGFSRGTFGVLQHGSGGDNQNGFGIRYDFSGTTLNINAQSRVQSFGTNISFPGGFGDTYLVLGKVNVNLAGGGDFPGVPVITNSIWVYPSSGVLPTTEPIVPMSTITLGPTVAQPTLAGTPVFPALYGRAFSNSQPTRFDEILIGETFADVAPFVPEPGSAATAALALLGLGFRRSRSAA